MTSTNKTMSLAAVLTAFSASAQGGSAPFEPVIRAGAETVGLQAGHLPIERNTFTCSSSRNKGLPDLLEDDTQDLRMNAGKPLDTQR